MPILSYILTAVVAYLLGSIPTGFLVAKARGIDIRTGKRVGKWFAGRFVRFVIVAPDGKSLLATSNLGVVRLPLEG